MLLYLMDRVMSYDARRLHAAVDQLLSNDIGRAMSLLSLLFLSLMMLRVVAALINFVYVYFLRRGRNLKFYGSWAIITGATDGIGKAYAVELAKRGLNLVVISRTPARLEELATELESKYNVEVRSCAIDLSNINMGDLETIKKSFEGLDVGLLVNNAGMSYDHPEYLEAMPAELDMQLIAINTTAPLLLAKLVLPGMKERKKGIIANIGSANGLLPAVPLLCTYAGTKAFINQFSRSLDVELRNFGVRVHDQCPLFVATKMSKIKRARLDAPTPEVWARAAVKQLGYEAVLTPYWFHGLMMAVIQCFAPQWAVVNYIDRLHLGFRKGYYKRLQRKAAEAKKAG